MCTLHHYSSIRLSCLTSPNDQGVRGKERVRDRREMVFLHFTSSHLPTRTSRSNTACAQEHSTQKVGAWRRDFSHPTNVFTRFKRIEYPIQPPQDRQTSLSTRTHHAFRTEGCKKTSKIVLHKQLQRHTDRGDHVSHPLRDQQRRWCAWPCGAVSPHTHPHATHGQLSPLTSLAPLRLFV